MSVIKSGVAQTSCIVVAEIWPGEDGSRGYIVGEVKVGSNWVQRGSASIHKYGKADTFVEKNSFSMPVKQGEEWQVKETATGPHGQYPVKTRVEEYPFP